MCAPIAPLTERGAPGYASAAFFLSPSPDDVPLDSPEPDDESELDEESELPPSFAVAFDLRP